MTTPLPYARAIGHGLGACAIVAAVALLWHWTSDAHGSTLAVMTAAGTGVLAWIGATIAADASHPLAADNDNHPFDPLFLSWTPVADGEA